MKDLTYTCMVVDVNDLNYEQRIKMAEVMEIPCIVIDNGEVISTSNVPVDEFCTLKMVNQEEEDYIYDRKVDEFQPSSNSAPNASEKTNHQEPLDAHIGPSKTVSPVHDAPIFQQFANVDDEPESIDKDFLKAQLSTKNQAILRNVLAIISSLAVVVAFILEKLGVL